MKVLSLILSLAAVTETALGASTTALSAPPNSRWCVLSNKVANSPPGPQMRVDLAHQFGMKMVRTQNIRIPFVAEELNRPQWKLLQQAGFDAVVTYANRESGGVTSGPVKDLKKFAVELEAAIKATKPKLVVIENEEAVEKFFTGTPEEYLAELNTAVEVAHRLGYPIMNGGITSLPIQFNMFEDYASQGHPEKAADLIRRLLPNQPGLGRGWPGVRQNPRYKKLLEAGRVLLEGYRQSKIDYVNFHWYSGDIPALREAITYVEAKTGKKVASNEIGQHDQNPATTQAVLNEVLNFKLPFACWYDGDGPVAYGLHNPDGSLRPTGKAFQEFVKAHP